MALISTPGSRQTILLGQGSDIIAALGPTLEVAVQCQQMLSGLSLFLFLRTYFAVSCLLFASRIVAVQSAFVSRFMLLQTAMLSKRFGRAVWNSQPIRRLRKKLQFEFFTFVLGGGNSLCLLLFWPGWWILGLMTITAWLRSG
ncbi:hypothetical protein JX265_011224 [Neoarthrinium moseri]|uniref:Uncharacterized protein n=1 Tax=Neoarthrinium moseri TaxID=1658444 RepID=A0A9Q0AJP5_9PEZI|nr:uncharacterized protein JN550_010530 [Neoarthrinium moseri]KAI1857489.1 hypothetical protein JX265_011224 [Neoarthrinium moseri]KAI1862065.1 hypothetical protein JN550_010530 [Neoarthrinium moseri]